jgi:hypothetical protein
MQQITGDGPPVLAMLRAAYQVTREVLAGLPPTGLKWKRPQRECPPWCARDHRCTAQHGYPSGEHRSPGDIWRQDYGRILATRTLNQAGRTDLDLTIRIRLADDGNTALAQSINLPLVVNEAIRTCLAEVDLMMRHRAILEAARTRSIGRHARQLGHRTA